MCDHQLSHSFVEFFFLRSQRNTKETGTEGGLLTIWGPPPVSQEQKEQAQKVSRHQVLYKSQKPLSLLECIAPSWDHRNVSRWLVQVPTFGFGDISWVLLHIQHLNISQVTYLHTPHVSSEEGWRWNVLQQKDYSIITEGNVYKQGVWRGVALLNPGKQEDVLMPESLL